MESEDYKNRNRKNRAYDELMEFCQTSVCSNANKDFVVKKIQGIRDSFRKELKKKINETKRSGSSEEEVYKPNLLYFDLLLFTRDQEEPTESIDNIDEEINENEIVKEKNEESGDLGYHDGVRDVDLQKEEETEKKETEQLQKSTATCKPIKGHKKKIGSNEGQS